METSFMQKPENSLTKIMPEIRNRFLRVELKF